MQTPDLSTSAEVTRTAAPQAPAVASAGQRIEAGFNQLFRLLMLSAGLLLAILMFAQVIMRYVLESPFTGIEEASILLAVWVYFLGMGYATRQHDHIHGGILSLVVKDPYKTMQFRLFGSVICMLAAVVFGYFAIIYALKEIDRGRLSINLRWPRGIWSASMIVGFSMMVLYFLLNARQQIRDLKALKQSRQEQQ